MASTEMVEGRVVQVAGPAVEAVHVASPNARHDEQARRVLESGRHVVCLASTNHALRFPDRNTKSPVFTAWARRWSRSASSLMPAPPSASARRERAR